MKRKMKAGSTSVTLPIFVVDSSSSTGAGLSVAYNTAGLVGEYRRQGQSSWTAITLATATLGTFTSGGWIADGSLTGAVEVGIPNAALATGATFVIIRFRGVTNMRPVLIEIELDAVDYQDASAFGLANLDAAVSTRAATADSRFAYLDAAVSTRLATAGYTVPPTTAAIAAAILVTPANKIATDASGYVVSSNVIDKTGYKLAADAWDLIIAEPGINARQALSPILAAVAGTLSGAGTGSIIIKGAGNATTRIIASTDNAGNRTSISLSLPA